ncbi:hypothetical protein PENSPDRAFT_430681 [Peniophora sp. CONT]|nr:hypothetical protein PENSPDRAFT_430681 [Peniophora sp. CONT]
MNASTPPNELKDAWDQRLAALGDDAKAIESSMQAAQAVIRHHAERLNSLNRIVCLPAEILEPIFLAVQAADPFTGRLHHSWSAEAEWILISHVCRRWRQVATGFSDLWTDIDVDWYGIPLCKEMLSRLGSREFSLRATIKKHQDFLFEMSLRQRIPMQLSGLTLNFDDTVTQPGAFLDTLLSYVTAHSNPVLRDLQMTCRNPEDMYWATLARVLPGLTSMQFTYLYLGGSIPTLLPTLTELTFTTVDLTSNGPDAAGILDLIPALPALESLTFNNCSFSPLDAPKAVLPQCMELVHFEASHEWSLQQCRALSRMLTQTTGDRVFVIGHANPNVAEELLKKLKTPFIQDWMCMKSLLNSPAGPLSTLASSLHVMQAILRAMTQNEEVSRFKYNSIRWRLLLGRLSAPRWLASTCEMQICASYATREPLLCSYRTT